MYIERAIQEQSFYLLFFYGNNANFRGFGLRSVNALSSISLLCHTILILYLMSDKDRITQ